MRSTTFNAAEQDSRCVKKRRALQKAYMTHLMRTMLAKLRDYLRELFRGFVWPEKSSRRPGGTAEAGQSGGRSSGPASMQRKRRHPHPAHGLAGLLKRKASQK
jgi:hypothetical protein